MMNIAAGVDIGGTHITVCLVDLTKEKLVEDSMVRMPIDTSLNKEDIIRAWAEAISAAHMKVGLPVGKVGIAMPGPFDYTNGICYIKGLHKYEDLYGVNIKEKLGHQLGISLNQIRFINDASAFLLGEIHAGAGKGFRNVVGLTLGTGLGSAVYAGGLLVEGDLYRTPYRDGTCEDYFSARSLIAAYKQQTGKSALGVKEIAAAAETDEELRLIFSQFGQNLVALILEKYTPVAPEAVIIGGNIANAWEYLMAASPQARTDVVFKKALLGEKAALAGSAFLWAD